MVAGETKREIACGYRETQGDKVKLSRLWQAMKLEYWTDWKGWTFGLSFPIANGNLMVGVLFDSDYFGSRLAIDLVVVSFTVIR
jgi:hypothetical protein